jgi:hypothetical protein
MDTLTGSGATPGAGTKSVFFLRNFQSDASAEEWKAAYVQKTQELGFVAGKNSSFKFFNGQRLEQSC